MAEREAYKCLLRTAIFFITCSPPTRLDLQLQVAVLLNKTDPVPSRGQPRLLGPCVAHIMVSLNWEGRHQAQLSGYKGRKIMSGLVTSLSAPTRQMESSHLNGMPIVPRAREGVGGVLGRVTIL